MALRNGRVFGLVVWLCLLAVSAWGFVNLPDRPMAVHFGLDGADGFAARNTGLMIMPGVALAIYVLLLWLIPLIRPNKAPTERSATAYGATTVAILMLLLGVHILLVLVAAGRVIDPVGYICVGVGLLFVVLGNYLPKTRQNPVMGIRTTWTLADERVWDRTHRFAGPWFMAGGLGIVASGLVLPTYWQIAAILIGALVPSIVSGVYSYMVAKELKVS